MRLSLVRCIAVLIVAFAAPILVEAAQPAGIELNRQGWSYIYPALASEGWSLTRWKNTGAHMGDDYFAQDWARSCGQTRGQIVYASISGTIAVAGWQSGYGKTVIIYDGEKQFALRYGHLDSIAVDFGQDVIAGQTKIGTVGNTGTVSGSCSKDAGAHLHLTLYKNVIDINRRPITSIRASGNATSFAADFRYVCPVLLARAANDPTLYAVQNGARQPVSWFVFNHQGWNFDRSKTMFNPVQIWTTSQLRRYPQGWFYPPRNGTLVKGDGNPTVFLIEREQKRGMSWSVFVCRGFQFSDVITIPQDECNSYPRGSDLRGCG